MGKAVRALALALALSFPASSMAATTWTAEAGSDELLWTSITSSSDGKNLAGVVFLGGIYTSNDFGVTWERKTTANRRWSSITSSSDGTRLAATVQGGDIWVSSNSGATWVQRDEVDRQWSSITSSSDGTFLAATVTSTLFSTGRVWTSNNSGLTWKAQSSAGDRRWSDIASSSDGKRLVATTNPGDIYTSKNSGVSWTISATLSANVGQQLWNSVASSDDGLKLAAVNATGGIFTSTDGGDNWIDVSFGSGEFSSLDIPSIGSIPIPDYNFTSIASNNDGTRLAATTGGLTGIIWTSTDSGQNWDPEVSAGMKLWTTVDISDSDPSSSNSCSPVASSSSSPVASSSSSPLSPNSCSPVASSSSSPQTSSSSSHLSPSSSDALPTRIVAAGTGTRVWTGYVGPTTVTYLDRFGTILETFTTFGGVLSRPADPPARPGFTFLGWDIETENNYYQHPVTYPLSLTGEGDYASFYPVWQWQPKPLTVSLNAAGGSSVSAVLTDLSRQVPRPATPSRPGYTFNGWFTAASGGTPLVFPFVTSQTSNFVLYAQWTAIPVLTVTYETYGGTPITSSSVLEGGTLSAPVSPVKSGYTFVGWAPGMGSPVQFPYAHGQTSDFTLHATWTANELTVSYDATGGSRVANGQAYTDQVMSAAPANPTRSGHTFKGWFTSRSGGSEVTFPYTHGQTSNFKLYAQWEAILTVAYSTAGGSAIPNGSVASSQTLSDPGVPTRSGFTFNGWFTQATGGEPITFPYVHNQTTSFRLYAQWTGATTFSVTTQSATARVNAVSAIQYVTVTNTGRANLEIGNVGLVGNNASEFTVVSNTCTNATVLPNATCRIGYRFAPRAAGSRTATFEIDIVSTGQTKDVIVNGV